VPWSGEELIERARRAWDSRSEPVFVFAEEIPSTVSHAECRELARIAKGKRVLEVGSYFGRSTVALASTAAVVHSVDLHPPDNVDSGTSTTLDSLIDNLNRYDLRHRVVLHVGFSQLILQALRRHSFDLVFLDAQHQSAPVREDLQAILPLVNRDGTIAFHDYGVPGVEHAGRWDPFGVTEVVDDFAASHGYLLDVTETLAVVRLARIRERGRRAVRAAAVRSVRELRRVKHRLATFTPTR
jgi:predicted O-methyltransferase YrrM